MLKELIAFLQTLDPDAVIRHGFGSAHSYRGEYTRVAFSPVENAVVKDMLQHAMSAVGTTYPGWKGGEYRMDEWTPCHIAEQGECGSDAINDTLFAYWRDDAAQGECGGSAASDSLLVYGREDVDTDIGK